MVRQLPALHSIIAIVIVDSDGEPRVEPQGAAPPDDRALAEIVQLMERCAPGHRAEWLSLLTSPELAPVIVLDDLLGPVLLAGARPTAEFRSWEPDGIVITSPGGCA